MTDAERQFAGEEQEISLNDIVDFFVSKWKILLTGTLLGLAVAAGGALLLGRYEAEATLVNKSGVDYLTWKDMKRNLPILAARILEANAGEGGFLKALPSEAWWQKNVVPTFSLAKEDAKAIVIPKELQDAESAKIKNFVVTAAGASKEEALKNLAVATSFLRSGGAYLALKDVIAGYRIELLNSESAIAKEIAVSEIELAYLNSRLASLGSLKAQFPRHTASIIAQPVGPKDSGAKYLPIVTQIIAAHKDIGVLKENLSRLNSRKGQLAVMDSFLSQAVPVMDSHLDGLAAAVELMRIEADMRKGLQASDWNRVSALNEIRHDLVSIQTRFTLGLEQPTFFDARKPSYRKPAAIGLAGGFFLALLFAFGSVVWSRYREQKLRG